MNKKIPSISSLLAFEATSRYLSFTRAAIELNLTQTAVSHQIKNLEELLGTSLFIRNSNGIALTDNAKIYLSSIREAIIILSNASDNAATETRANTLTVECLGAFAIKKLIPNLYKFRTLYPNIEIKINTIHTLNDTLKRNFDVELDPESEAVVTMGSKEGLGHLALATLDKGDAVLVPNPSYPIHPYGFVIAGADIRHVPIGEGIDFFAELEAAVTNSFPKPKMLVLNFPSNPSTECVDIEFFEKIIAFAKENKIWVIQDLAYADICFDGYKAPSILQVKGAKDVAVEFYTLSKSYNMPGWRVGFCCGNKDLLAALSRIKSYFGLFS